MDNCTCLCGALVRECSYYVSLQVCVIVASCCVILLNVVLLIFLSFKHKLRTNRHYVLVMFLLITDTFVGLTTLNLIVFVSSDEINYSLCKTLVVFWSITVILSTSNVFLISMERFLAANNSVKLLRKRVVCPFVIFIWTSTILYFCIVSSSTDVLTADSDCRLNNLFVMNDNTELFWSNQIFKVVFISFTIVLYVMTVHKIRKQKRVLPSANISFNVSTSPFHTTSTSTTPHRNTMATFSATRIRDNSPVHFCNTTNDQPTSIHVYNNCDMNNSKGIPTIKIFRDSVTSIGQTPHFLETQRERPTRISLTRYSKNSASRNDLRKYLTDTQETRNEELLTVHIEIPNDRFSFEQVSYQRSEIVPEPRTCAKAITSSITKLDTVSTEFLLKDIPTSQQNVISTTISTTELQPSPTKSSTTLKASSTTSSTTTLQASPSICSTTLQASSTSSSRSKLQASPTTSLVHTGSLSALQESRISSLPTKIHDCRTLGLPRPRRKWQTHASIRISIIILFELCCFLPVIGLAFATLVFDKYHYFVDIVCMVFVIAHALGNPFVYALSNPQFRKIAFSCTSQTT